MNGKDVRDLLIEILYYTINDVAPKPSFRERFTPSVQDELYHLAKKHDLAHVVSNFVYRYEIEVLPEVKEKLQREEVISIYRTEQQRHSFNEICTTFDESPIAYIPLKGAIIRPYYPYDSMRTSCDIDILIHEEDLDAAISSLEAKGYECGDRHYHDVSLYSPNRVHLELHFNIQENIDSLDAILKNAWSYAVPTVGYRYDFQKEFFVYHMYAHMAYHFLSGGCGIRSLVDIWVMEKKMDAPYSLAEKLLEKAGILQFASEMSRLAEGCLTNNERDEFDNTVLKYIFSGGVYGSVENSITSRKAKNEKTLPYVLKRLFLPYSSMAILFPVLKKAPYLLPFCWIARWIRSLFKGKTKQAMHEVDVINNADPRKVEDIKRIHARFGL